MNHQALFDLACKARENAYTPYSNYRVGACILTEDGSTFTGCNFENASYGATICAERNAAGNAIVNGARKFSAIAVVGSSAVAWPCGICRQVLSEFADPDMKVIVGEFAKGFTVTTLGKLLPGNLTAADLGVEINN